MFLLQDAPRRHSAPQAAPFRVSEIREVEGLCALSGQWRELYAQTAHPSPFTSWEWAWAWWRHFGASAQGEGREGAPSVRRLRVVTVHDADGLLLAIAPLYGSAPASPLMSRETRPFGDDGRDGEGMTDEPTLLLRAGHEETAMRALLRSLLRGRHTDWDALKVRLPQSSPSGPGGIAQTLLGPDTPFHRVRREEGPQVVALPETWATFRRTLSRSMRDNLAYYPRRLVRNGHDWRVELVREPGRMRPAVDILVDLHNRRAHSSRGIFHLSHIPGERQAAFLRESLAALAANGMATVALLTVDGQPAAAQAFLEADGGASGGREMVAYYSGFSPDWYDYSPVTLLGAAAIEDATARGVTRLNFLPGATPWKERWGTQRQGIIEDLRCLRPHPAALGRVFCRSLHRSLTLRGGESRRRDDKEKAGRASNPRP